MLNHEGIAEGNIVRVSNKVADWIFEAMPYDNDSICLLIPGQDKKEYMVVPSSDVSWHVGTGKDFGKKTGLVILKRNIVYSEFEVLGVADGYTWLNRLSDENGRYYEIPSQWLEIATRTAASKGQGLFGNSVVYEKLYQYLLQKPMR